jgi:hypothetical protein
MTACKVRMLGAEDPALRSGRQKIRFWQNGKINLAYRAFSSAC